MRCTLTRGNPDVPHIGKRPNALQYTSQIQLEAQIDLHVVSYSAWIKKLLTNSLDIPIHKP